MKTLKITITLIATILCNLTLSATNSFVYNTEIDGNGTITQTVYKLDKTEKYLTPQWKYNISYDNENRMQEKEVLSWDSNNGKWVNHHTLSFDYSEDAYTIEYAKWNKSTHEYSDAVLKTTYTLDQENQQYQYNSYKADNASAEWMLTQSLHFQSEPEASYAQNK